MSTEERDLRIFKVSKTVSRGRKCPGIVLCVFSSPKDTESLSCFSCSSAEQESYTSSVCEISYDCCALSSTDSGFIAVSATKL